MVKIGTVIRKTENEIVKKKINIKKLGNEYANISTKNTGRERRIFSTMRSQKREKNQLEHLVKRMNNRKKTMKTMVWKRDKSLTENILDNLDNKIKQKK